MSQGWIAKVYEPRMDCLDQMLGRSYTTKLVTVNTPNWNKASSSGLMKDGFDAALNQTHPSFFFCQTLRLQQFPAAAAHLGGMIIPRPPSIMSTRVWTEDPKWLRENLCEYMLVTSEPEIFGLLPLVSFDEFKVPASDWRNSELWEPPEWNCSPTVSCTSLSVLPFPLPDFLVFKKRPPHPLGRRIAWRWRDSCI